MKHQPGETGLPSGNILDFHARLLENWLKTMKTFTSYVRIEYLIQ